MWAEVPFISIISENECAKFNIKEQMRRLILQCEITPLYTVGVYKMKLPLLEKLGNS